MYIRRFVSLCPVITREWEGRLPYLQIVGAAFDGEGEAGEAGRPTGRAEPPVVFILTHASVCNFIV